jgi:aconitase A
VNSFNAKATFRCGETDYTIYRLDALEKFGCSMAKLPYCLRVLLENLLRNENERSVFPADVLALAQWDPKAEPSKEISFTPARVLLQDFTGVPCVVDLAAMREAMGKLGGKPKKINPLQPVELVIDHSVQVDAYGSEAALLINRDLEYERNKERYEFLKWGQTALDNFKVVPPNTGIVHQVNLEHLARVTFVAEGVAGASRSSGSATGQGQDAPATPEDVAGASRSSGSATGQGQDAPATPEDVAGASRSSGSRAGQGQDAPATPEDVAGASRSSGSATGQGQDAPATPVAFPDTLVGTDSHTTMINGLGVVGWGVGGIEAEACMLGQPIYLVTPAGRRLQAHGKLPEGSTATDLVLTVTQILRKPRRGREVRRVLRRRPRHMSVADRATIANMAPSTARRSASSRRRADARYLRLTGREPEQIDLVERYCKEQGLWRQKKSRAELHRSPRAGPRDGRAFSVAGPRSARRTASSCAA